MARGHSINALATSRHFVLCTLLAQSYNRSLQMRSSLLSLLRHVNCGYMLTPLFVIVLKGLLFHCYAYEYISRKSG